MIGRSILAALALLGATPAALAAPVEVTRFHTSDSVAALARTAVAVVAAPGTDATSLETRVWLLAVEAELAALHFGSATPGVADCFAEVRVDRQVERAERRRGPVSVGVGGSTGGWNSGVGLGIGFNLGGGPRSVVYTRLAVTIRSRVTGQALWEGRAESAEKESAKAAAVDRAAPRMAHALFSGFPGTSGATIKVR